MKVKITRQTRVVAMPCIMEVSEAEAVRLFTMGVAEPIVENAMAEISEIETKKARKGKK